MSNRKIKLSKISFASDNNSGVHPKIMKALINANVGQVVAYGDDYQTEKTINKFKSIFGKEIEVFFVFGGTAANVLGLKSVTETFNAIICAETSHINVNECAAPERFTGCKLLDIPTQNGKINVEQISYFMHGFGDQHHVQPKIISITQPTEMGTVYTIDEIRKIADYAHKNNLLLHMDGARIANAVVSLGADITDITKNAGVDILSFGGTKNGMMYGEAVIFFKKELAKNFAFIRKQSMQLASKMRFIASQFEAFLTDNLWLKNAKQANEMAKLLAKRVKEISNIEVTQKTQANAVFAIIPSKCIRELQKKYFFYVWNEYTNEVRWMTSFDTQKKNIEQFVAFLAKTIDNL